MSNNIQALLDRQEIEDLLIRYGSALDERDWQKLCRCFTPDACADYGDFGQYDGYEAIEGVCRSTLIPLDSSQHLIGNIEVHLAGDIATTRCNLQAQHTREIPEGGNNLTFGCVYRDELIRTEEGWRIRKRQMSILWQEGNPAVMEG